MPSSITSEELRELKQLEHTHNGGDKCPDFSICTLCHCHLQDERHTICCRIEVRDLSNNPHLLQYRTHRFPIVDDPQADFAETGKNAEVPGLYGRETMQRAICIDFDGVLHAYSDGWKGHGEIYDDPVPGALQACNDLVDAGWKLYVLTSRSDLRPVAEWLHKQHFPPMTLTRVKPISVAYIDDRAVRFEGSWPSIRKLFA